MNLTSVITTPAEEPSKPSAAQTSLASKVSVAAKKLAHEPLGLSQISQKQKMCIAGGVAAAAILGILLYRKMKK
jgi:hypothetical protein